MLQLLALIRFLLLVGALTYLLTRSAIFSPLRMGLGKLHVLVMTLVYCPACSAFWLGMTVGFSRWPWEWQYIPIEPALASCVLGSVLGTVWGSDAVAAELEALGYGSSKTEEIDG